MWVDERKANNKQPAVNQTNKRIMSLKHISTKEDYEVYKARVAHFLARNNVKPGCFSESKPNQTLFFSWSVCHCCERNLGGNRENYSFATNNGHMFDADICEDCIYFLTYGKLDDLTMLNLGLPVSL